MNESTSIRERLKRFLKRKIETYFRVIERESLCKSKGDEKWFKVAGKFKKKRHERKISITKDQKSVLQDVKGSSTCNGFSCQFVHCTFLVYSFFASIWLENTKYFARWKSFKNLFVFFSLCRGLFAPFKSESKEREWEGECVRYWLATV